MNIEVKKKDILNIGYEHHNFDGVLVIYCDHNTEHIEQILLRSILKCFGEKYTITEIDDCLLEEGNPNNDKYFYDIMFVTNLPYEMFEEVDRDV
jgi:hypothetical protein